MTQCAENMPPVAGGDNARQDWPRWVAPVGLAVLGLLLLGWSWRKWADPVVDFGSTLYLPWRLAQGERLYADHFFYYGPLAQYLHAAAFRLAGASYSTFLAVNGIVTALVTAGLYRLARPAYGTGTAFAAGAVFLTVFAFGHYSHIANYNFMSPYGPETTVGILLGLGMVLSMGHYVQAGGGAGATGAALCLGALHLTKPDLSLAGLATGAVFTLWLTGFEKQSSWRRRLIRPAAFWAVTSIPFIVTWALLAATMTAREAFWGAFGAWSLLLSDPLGNNIFLLRTAGLAEWFPNLAITMKTGLLGICWLVGAVGGVRWLASPWRLRRVFGAVFLTLLAITLFRIDWFAAARGVPVLLAVAVGGWSWEYIRPGGSNESKPGWADGAGCFFWAIFAAALLPKMLLHFRFSHYGFYLALPAVTTLVYAGLGYLPDRLTKRSTTWAAGWMKVMTGLACLALILSAWRFSEVLYREKTFEIGSDGDRCRVFGPAFDERSGIMREVWAWGRDHLPPGATVAVWPEGVWLNYLWRAPNPTPYRDLIYLAMAPGRLPEYLQSLVEHPADYILILQRPTAEYGPAFFGRDYGQPIMEWIRAHYRSVKIFGFPPFSSDRFGVEVWQRGPVNPHK